ncbi:hypothetical protein KIL84_020691 [Mauremys mutica]|uniref:Uncharacterized protein n=1 Tax=Mauremys mutica TaxID=74926 RepID=A0A9D3X9L3_9SAUR|nr:hypothetical protein KIL84_020691 [Mauremys mutica]
MSFQRKMGLDAFVVFVGGYVLFLLYGYFQIILGSVVLSALWIVKNVKVISFASQKELNFTGAQIQSFVLNIFNPIPTQSWISSPCPTKGIVIYFRNLVFL